MSKVTNIFKGVSNNAPNWRGVREDGLMYNISVPNMQKRIRLLAKKIHNMGKKDGEATILVGAVFSVIAGIAKTGDPHMNRCLVAFFREWADAIEEGREIRTE